MRFTKGMPSDTILRYIVAPPPAKDFLPRTINGKSISPKISYGMQKRIRDVCIMADVDPISIGLPPAQTPIEIYNSLPESVFVPVGKGHEKARYERQKKIAERLATMDKRITDWKMVIFYFYVFRKRRERKKHLNPNYHFDVFVVFESKGFSYSKSGNFSNAC